MKMPIRSLLLSAAAAVPFFVVSAANAQNGEKPSTAPAVDPGDAEAIATADRIEKKVEELRGLQFKHPVKKGIYDKERLAKFLQKMNEKENVGTQFAWQEKVYKMLGLIPPSMDMLKETTELLLDQIGGFYDPDSKELKVMRGFKGFIGDILMAHELCHALEDQHFQLKDVDDTNKKVAPDNDDRVFASHSVMEGSATDLMNRFGASAALEGKVKMEELLKSDMTANPALSGERAMKSPQIIVRPLLEMYMGGLAFLTRGGGLMARTKKADVKKAFLNPPLSSEQILHPEKYWEKDKLDLPKEVALPDVTKDLGEGWKRLGTNVMGELGISILTKPAPDEDEKEETDPIKKQMQMLMGSKTTLESEGWGGDRYEVYESKKGVNVLFWLTVWDKKEDAVQFQQWIANNLAKTSYLQMVSETDFGDNGLLVTAVRTPTGGAVDGNIMVAVNAASEAIVKNAKVTETQPWKRVLDGAEETKDKAKDNDKGNDKEK